MKKVIENWRKLDPMTQTWISEAFAMIAVGVYATYLSITQC